MNCMKRQTVVKRGPKGATTSHRCLHRDCGMYGLPVVDDTCSECPLKALKHVKPCDKPAPCTDCGKREREILAEFPDGPPPDFPSMSIQAFTYKEALRKWNAAGRPNRSQEEVDEIVENHCKGCSWFENNRCRGCGCRVTSGSFAVFNKVKMATEHCPRDFW